MNGTTTSTSHFGWLLIVGIVAAMPGVARGAGDLRERMGGVWSGQQRGDVLHFDGDLCVTALGSQQTIFLVQYQGDVARRTMAYSGQAVPGEITLRDGVLLVRVPKLEIEISYARLDTVPDSVRLDPLTLGERALNKGQLAAIRREIAQRSKQDQEIRAKLTGAGGGSNDQPALEAMISIDRQNTLRIIDLIQDVGWLDTARFGKKTHFGAFLIVQHSGNLRLMRTVLPLIEKEAKANREIGQQYALLFDRLQLSFGRNQRYGTQIVPGSDGRMTIARLEDRAHVDERRRELGMQSLAEYMKMASERNGTMITIGE